ncbi:MAG: sigma-70 family RNA polymerase sigma factor [Chloroflexi bacterium]|nr:sigma-70 family RNA polymerase sigma factor [Chloroflexota bacterium]
MLSAKEPRAAEVDDEIRDLVDRAARGDAQAFGLLYDRYLDPIYRYVYYRVGLVSEAEDLTEEIFLKAWEAIGKFRWQGVPFSAWLYRLAHNRVVDYTRRKRPSAPLLESVPAHGPDTETVVADRLEWERVVEAMRGLTVDQQEVLTLKFIEGYENDEIGVITGKREGAIRAIQFRALAALRSILGV